MSDPFGTELRSVTFFAGVAPQTLAILGRGAFAQSFPAGVELTVAGAKADFTFVLREGLVEQKSVRNDAQTTLGIVKPGRAFGLTSSLTDEPCLYSAETLARSRVLMIPAASLREAVEQDAGLAGALLRLLSQTSCDLLSEIRQQKLCSSLERLALWVREHAPPGGSFRMPFQKRTLAGLLGTTPENLSRSIQALRDHGVVFDGHLVKVEDPGALGRFVQQTAA